MKNKTFFQFSIIILGFSTFPLTPTPLFAMKRTQDSVNSLGRLRSSVGNEEEDEADLAGEIKPTPAQTSQKAPLSSHSLLQQLARPTPPRKAATQPTPLRKSQRSGLDSSETPSPEEASGSCGRSLLSTLRNLEDDSAINSAQHSHKLYKLGEAQLPLSRHSLPEPLDIRKNGKNYDNHLPDRYLAAIYFNDPFNDRMKTNEARCIEHYENATCQQTILKEWVQKPIKSVAKFAHDMSHEIANEILLLADWTPLHVVVASQKLELVTSLGDFKDIDTTTRMGITPLHIAAALGNADVFDSILQMKPNLNAQTFTSTETPFDLAVSFGHHDIAAQLIEAGCDVDVITERHELSDLTVSILKRKESNLHIISRLIAGLRFNNPIKSQEARFILEQKQLITGQTTLNRKLEDAFDLCDISAQATNNENWTALHLAIAWQDKDIVNVLKNHHDINLPTNMGLTALHIAAAIGNTEIFTFILHSKPNLDAQTFKSQETPLHMAISFRRPKIAALLIDAGCNLTLATSEDSFTPLHLALLSKQGDIAEKILSKWPEQPGMLLAKTKINQTVLHTAIIGGLAEKFLGILIPHAITHGIINAQDDFNLTPLHLAVYHFNFNHLTIERLSLAGANIDIPDVYNRSPLQISESRGLKACVDGTVAKMRQAARNIAEESKSPFAHFNEQPQGSSSTIRTIQIESFSGRQSSTRIPSSSSMMD
jgi:ankyrin repeat protein